jgi:hypothetical protein
MSLNKLKLIPLLALALSASLTISPAHADSEGKKANASQTQGGLLPGETREQKRERLLTGIEKQVGTLNADQKAHILAVLKAAGDEMAAARANKSLTEEQQKSVVSKIHSEVSSRYFAALTPQQQLKLKTNPAFAANNRGQGLRAGESFEQRRERLLKNYEEVIPDLSIKQKSEILAINEVASDEMGAIRSIESLSAEQKKAAILKTHENVTAKISLILTDSQRARWKKDRTERKAAKAEKEKAEKTAVAKY